MRVCFVATYYTKDYIRQTMILESLKQTGFEIVECIENQKSFLRYAKILWRFWKAQKDCDIIVAGYRCQEIMPFLKFLTKKKIIFDAFLSFYNRACFDRKMFFPTSLRGKFLFWLDKYSCQISDIVLLDTNAHIKYFAKTFGLPKQKFRRIFIGAQNNIFTPQEKKQGGKFVVLWYGSFIPLQGTDKIVEAAKILSGRNVFFWLVGGKKGLELENLRFFEKARKQEILRFASKADVCLGGHFNENESAKTVIAGKAFEMIAMKKPLVVGESNATKELFTDKENVLMCKMGNANDLAEKILLLKQDSVLREKIAKNGHELYLKKATPQALSFELKKILLEAL